MNDSLYIAATGMQAQQLSLDTIANNLVNVNTPGFKRSRVNFNELMHVGTEQNVNSLAGASTGRALGIGINVDSVARDFSPGALTQTNLPLDVSINGSGFLEVTLADGSHGYTRGGTMQITKDSFLATSAGYALKSAIHIPANITALTISQDGKVSVQTSAGGQTTEIGQLELVNFANPGGLKMAGSGVYVPTDASGQAMFGKPGSHGMGTIAQGTLESSNVSMVDEMVTLMIAQKAYELSSKVAQASDEMMSMTNNLRK